MADDRLDGQDLPLTQEFLAMMLGAPKLNIRDENDVLA
jgi:hypothetical protein